MQSIKDQNEVAEKLDALKLNTMSQTNPDYPLLKFGSAAKAAKSSRGAQSEYKKDDSASQDTTSQISRKSTY